MKDPKPTPIVTSQKCSICDLDWELHPQDATVFDCIKLLKAVKPYVYTSPQPYITYPWYSGTVNTNVIGMDLEKPFNPLKEID